MRYLIVVAHPDDEVLGAGATIQKLTKEGHDVAVAIFSGHADARANLSANLAEEQNKALQILGVTKVYSADFPNIKMNVVPHLELVQFVESCIQDFQSEVIFTHHPSDVNIDHQEAAKAVNAAVRLFQRKEGVPKFRMLAYMEILSSTEWSVNTSQSSFRPNYFIEVGKVGIEKKIEALSIYEGVMRPFPHPRSNEAIFGLAAYRGGQSGLEYAEAFECVFMSNLLQEEFDGAN